MSYFEAMMRAYEQAGGDPGSLRSPGFASLVVNGNMVLSTTEVQALVSILRRSLAVSGPGSSYHRELACLPRFTCASGCCQPKGCRKSNRNST